MPSHKIALVGAGRMGSLHASNAAANPRLALVAVADHNQALASKAAAHTGAEVKQFDAMLADEAIEAVISNMNWVRITRNT